MVSVIAPRFDVAECNSEAKRAFIEALHSRATAGQWYADSWPRKDRIILSVSCIRSNCVVRTLRVDFDGQVVAYGDDETHQFVTNLNPASGATVITGRQPAELATLAADWLEGEIASWYESAR